MKILASIVIILSLAILAFVAVSLARARPNVSLHEGLSGAKTLIDTTAADALTGYEVVPMETNPDLRLARQLRNNHSLADHSNPDLFPNYEDCDSWRNVINDGWSASYGLIVTLPDEEDADAALVAVRRHWEKQGYEVQPNFHNRQSNETFDLWADADYATFRVYINRVQGKAYLTGVISCLPPA